MTSRFSHTKVASNPYLTGIRSNLILYIYCKYVRCKLDKSRVDTNLDQAL